MEKKMKVRASGYIACTYTHEGSGLPPAGLPDLIYVPGAFISFL